MRAPKPAHDSTEILDERSWRPASLATLLDEIERLRDAAAGAPDQSVVLYRGQRDAAWSVNSTFAREVVEHYESSDPWYGNRVHQALVDKFSATGIRPSAELESVADSDGCDPWFELMKRIQQHPDEFAQYPGLRGSNLVDWSRSLKVGLAFAAEDTDREGALYVLDAVAAGGIFVGRPVREMLDLMEENLVNGKLHGQPILFSPSRQVAYERAKRQDACYIAQMDLRYSLDHVWQASDAERADGESIYWRVLLTPTVKAEVNAYLEACGCTAAWLLEPPA